MASRLNIDLR